MFIWQCLMGESKWEKGVETASSDFLRFPAVSCGFLRLQTTYLANQGPNLQKSAKIFDKLPFLPFSLSHLLREAKPGGFQTRVFPTFFGKGRTLSGLFLVGALNYYRPRKRKRTNRENPRTIPEQIGKIPEKSGESQKG